MKISSSSFLSVFLVSFSTVFSAAQDFDFFYFVEQWPGSYCDTKRSCCYPTTGKPAVDFGIHGLWPNYNDGSWPSNCDPDSPYDRSRVEDLTEGMQAHWPTLACPSSDGTKFWTHEWEKHGTCSESILNQHDYFRAALDLHRKANLLQALLDAGIHPDDKLYSLSSIKQAISQSIGFTPGIECNVDGSRHTQLYQVYLCVDVNATEFIHCPVYPRSRCPETVQFPYFGSINLSREEQMRADF